MEKREYTVGEFWLAMRPDGKSPYWQIVSYDEESRTTRYRSTRCRELEDAKKAIHAHHARVQAEGRQDPNDAAAVPLLMLYWEEHGKRAIKPAQIASSLRQFIAFLKQDKLGIAASVAELKPEVFRRFIRWRMSPHGYKLAWLGKEYAHQSPGVNGESVQRNLDDVRAALNHHVKEGRLPYAPKVPAVEATKRSAPRDRVLSMEELGSMIGYATSDEPLLRFILAQLGTLARPEAVLKWNVAKQADFSRGLFDVHPQGAPRTKKRNPVVPICDGLWPWLRACNGPWIEDGKVASIKTRWRTMRRVLGLSSDVVPKTIRHTVATILRGRGVAQLDIEGLLGHRMSNRATAVYAKYDPAYLSAAKHEIDRVWCEALESARNWLADHLRTKSKKGAIIIVAREGEKG